MANRFFFLPLFFLLLLIATTATLSSAGPPPSQLPETQDNDQFNKIIDALIGSGDFAGWASVLSTTDVPSNLPLTATFFIPTNDAVSNLTGANVVDPLLIPYHIVPQRLTFSDLKRFATRTRLPTLLPHKYVVITSNSSENFTVDDSQIIHPDIFDNAAFAVHGIKNVMDYSAFGGGGRVIAPSPAVVKNNTSSSLRPKSRPEKKGPVFPSDVSDGGDSCESSEFLIAYIVFMCIRLVIFVVIVVVIFDI